MVSSVDMLFAKLNVCENAKPRFFKPRPVAIPLTQRER